MASSSVLRRRGPATYVRRAIAVVYLFLLVAWPVALVVRSTSKPSAPPIRMSLTMTSNDELLISAEASSPSQEVSTL